MLFFLGNLKDIDSFNRPIDQPVRIPVGRFAVIFSAVDSNGNRGKCVVDVSLDGLYCSRLTVECMVIICS